MLWFLGPAQAASLPAQGWFPPPLKPQPPAGLAEQPRRAQRGIPVSLRARGFVFISDGTDISRGNFRDENIRSCYACYTRNLQFLVRSPAPDSFYIVNFNIIFYLFHSGVHLVYNTYPSKYPISPLSQETDVHRSNQERRLFIFFPCDSILCICHSVWHFPLLKESKITHDIKAWFSRS